MAQGKRGAGIPPGAEFRRWGGNAGIGTSNRSGTCGPSAGRQISSGHQHPFEHRAYGSLADLIEFCSEEEMPPFIKKVINDIRTTIYPSKESDEENGRSDEASPEQIESLE